MALEVGEGGGGNIVQGVIVEIATVGDEALAQSEAALERHAAAVDRQSGSLARATAVAERYSGAIAAGQQAVVGTTGVSGRLLQVIEQMNVGMAASVNVVDAARARFSTLTAAVNGEAGALQQLARIEAQREAAMAGAGRGRRAEIEAMEQMLILDMKRAQYAGMASRGVTATWQAEVMGADSAAAAIARNTAALNANAAAATRVAAAARAPTAAAAAGGAAGGFEAQFALVMAKEQFAAITTEAARLFAAIQSGAEVSSADIARLNAAFALLKGQMADAGDVEIAALQTVEREVNTVSRAHVRLGEGAFFASNKVATMTSAVNANTAALERNVTAATTAARPIRGLLAEPQLQRQLLAQNPTYEHPSFAVQGPTLDPTIAAANVRAIEQETRAVAALQAELDVVTASANALWAKMQSGAVVTTESVAALEGQLVATAGDLERMTVAQRQQFEAAAAMAGAGRTRAGLSPATQAGLASVESQLAGIQGELAVAGISAEEFGRALTQAFVPTEAQAAAIDSVLVRIKGDLAAVGLTTADLTAENRALVTALEEVMRAYVAESRTALEGDRLQMESRARLRAMIAGTGPYTVGGGAGGGPPVPPKKEPLLVPLPPPKKEPLLVPLPPQALGGPAYWDEMAESSERAAGGIRKVGLAGMLSHSILGRLFSALGGVWVSYIFIAMIAINALIRLIERIAKPAVEAERAWQTLRQTVALTGGDFQSAKPQVEAMATSLDKLSGIKRLDVLQGLGTATRELGSFTSAMNVVPVAAALASATGGKLSEVIGRITAGVHGSTDVFREYGIHLTATQEKHHREATEASRLAVILQMLERQTARVTAENEKLIASDPTGWATRWQAVGQFFNNLPSMIGSVAGRIGTLFKNLFETVADVLIAMSKGVAAAIADIVETISPVFEDALSGAVDWMLRLLGVTREVADEAGRIKLPPTPGATEYAGAEVLAPAPAEAAAGREAAGGKIYAAPIGPKMPANWQKDWGQFTTDIQQTREALANLAFNFAAVQRAAGEYRALTLYGEQLVQIADKARLMGIALSAAMQRRVELARLMAEANTNDRVYMEHQNELQANWLAMVPKIRGVRESVGELSDAFTLSGQGGLLAAAAMGELGAKFDSMRPQIDAIEASLGEMDPATRASIEPSIRRFRELDATIRNLKIGGALTAQLAAASRASEEFDDRLAAVNKTIAGLGAGAPDAQLRAIDAELMSIADTAVLLGRNISRVDWENVLGAAARTAVRDFDANVRQLQEGADILLAKFDALARERGVDAALRAVGPQLVQISDAARAAGVSIGEMAERVAQEARVASGVEQLTDAFREQFTQVQVLSAAVERLDAIYGEGTGIKAYAQQILQLDAQMREMGFAVGGQFGADVAKAKIEVDARNLENAGRRVGEDIVAEMVLGGGDVGRVIAAAYADMVRTGISRLFETAFGDQGLRKVTGLPEGAELKAAGTQLTTAGTQLAGAAGRHESAAAELTTAAEALRAAAAALSTASGAGGQQLPSGRTLADVLAGAGNQYWVAGTQAQAGTGTGAYYLSNVPGGREAGYRPSAQGGGGGITFGQGVSYATAAYGLYQGAYTGGAQGGSLLGGTLTGAVGGLATGAAIGAAGGPIGAAAGAIIGAIIGFIGAYFGAEAHKAEERYGVPTVTGYPAAGGRRAGYMVSLEEATRNINPEEVDAILKSIRAVIDQFWNGYTEILMNLPTDVFAKIMDLIPKLEDFKIDTTRAEGRFQGAASDFWVKHLQQWMQGKLPELVSDEFTAPLQAAFVELGGTAREFQNIMGELDKLDPAKKLELLGLVFQYMTDFFETMKTFRTPASAPVGTPGAEKGGLLEQAQARLHSSFADQLRESDEDLVHFASMIDGLVGEERIRAAARLGEKMREREREIEQWFDRLAATMEDTFRSLDDFINGLKFEQLVTPTGEPDVKARIDFLVAQANEAWTHVQTAKTPEEVQMWSGTYQSIMQQILGMAREAGPETYQAYLRWAQDNTINFRQAVADAFARLGDAVAAANRELIDAIHDLIAALRGTGPEQVGPGSVLPVKHPKGWQPGDYGLPQVGPPVYQPNPEPGGGGGGGLPEPGGDASVFGAGGGLGLESANATVTTAEKSGEISANTAEMVAQQARLVELVQLQAATGATVASAVGKFVDADSRSIQKLMQTMTEQVAATASATSEAAKVHFPALVAAIKSTEKNLPPEIAKAIAAKSAKSELGGKPVTPPAGAGDHVTAPPPIGGGGPAPSRSGHPYEWYQWPSEAERTAFENQYAGTMWYERYWGRAPASVYGPPNPNMPGYVPRPPDTPGETFGQFRLEGGGGYVPWGGWPRMPVDEVGRGGRKPRQVGFRSAELSAVTEGNGFLRDIRDILAAGGGTVKVSGGTLDINLYTSAPGAPKSKAASFQQQLVANRAKR